MVFKRNVPINKATAKPAAIAINWLMLHLLVSLMQY